MLSIDSVCLFKPSVKGSEDSLSCKSRFERKLPSSRGLLSPRLLTNAQPLPPKEATGNTPFFLNHGRHPRGPATAATDCKMPAAREFAGKLSEAITRAKDCLKAAQARMKRLADTHRQDLEFSVGDEVLLSSKNLRIKSNGTRKLFPRFIGPFTVHKRVGKLAYELELVEYSQRGWAGSTQYSMSLYCDHTRTTLINPDLRYQHCLAERMSMRWRESWTTEMSKSHSSANAPDESFW